MLIIIVISIVLALYAAYREESGVFALFFLIAVILAFLEYVV